MSQILNTDIFDHTAPTCFLDSSVGISRFDKVKYPWMEKLTNTQLSYFWRPEEIDLYRDQIDFKSLTSHEQHIFTSNLRRQILLDSVQGRAPTLSFLPLCSLPELETWITTWAFSETIHSRSYTHIIRNVYPNPSEVFDHLLENQEIVACAKDISRYYDTLFTLASLYNSADHKSLDCSVEDLKKALYRALMSVNALEGVRFYASFACSWAFAENKKMEGNAKIIKLICRDENLHLAGTQQLLKTLPVEDKKFASIQEALQDEMKEMFVAVVEQEKQWAKFLFTGGSIIGLNEELLVSYVEYIAGRRAKAIGLDVPYKSTQNPLPWTQKWISGSEVQVAPQETEVQSYVVGDLNKTVKTGAFKGFKL